MKNKPSLWSAAPAAGRNFLILVLTLRIASYFMLSDNLVLVQTLKAGLRIALTFLLFISVFFQQRKVAAGSATLANPLPIWLYGLYLLFGAASLLWSSSFSASLLQWLMDAEGFLFAFLYIRLLLMWRQQHPGDAFSLQRLIAPAVVLTGFCFAAGLLLDPDHFYRLTHGGSVSRLGGYIINPNELGMLFVIGITCLLPRVQQDKKWRISILLAMGMLVQLLLLTGSRSSFIALMLVLLMYAFANGKRLHRVLFFAVALALIPFAGWSFFVKQDQLSELITLTGRLPFWHDLLTYNFPREPWLGYGYMRIDYADKFESLNAYAGAMTHNTFLQVLLGLGLVGFSIVLVQLAVFFWTLRRVADRSSRFMSGLLMIPLLINSMTEFGIFGETNYGILFYLFLVFSLAAEPLGERRRIKGHTGHENPGNLPYRSASFT
ncbi:MAG: O-antigen ligase family protein [Bacteroidia bacterium]|nr:O-antigen ligase family protein [Bacteroidia bacterium]